MPEYSDSGCMGARFPALNLAKSLPYEYTCIHT
jgi:hypothetical protein